MDEGYPALLVIYLCQSNASLYSFKTESADFFARDKYILTLFLLIPNTQAISSSLSLRINFRSNIVLEAMGTQGHTFRNNSILIFLSRILLNISASQYVSLSAYSSGTSWDVDLEKEHAVFLTTAARQATVTAYLDINLLGVATCEGSATARALVDVKVTVRLQQLTDTGWSTIKTWSATNEGCSSASGKYAVYSGYTYRTTVSAYVYDEDGNIIETGSASDTFEY